MALRLFFDECADVDVARALLALGLDVVPADSAGRKGLPDRDQLEYARTEDRVIYTIDADFLALAADMLQRGEFLTGILYHAPLARILDQLVQLFGIAHGSCVRCHQGSLNVRSRPVDITALHGFLGVGDKRCDCGVRLVGQSLLLGSPYWVVLLLVPNPAATDTAQREHGRKRNENSNSSVCLQGNPRKK